MSGMADIARDMHDIKQVKYRYLRALDSKHWDDFAQTLVEDVRGDYGPSLGNELHFTDRDALVDFMRTSLGPTIYTEHRVDHPEITFDGPDEASATWYLQDRVIAPEFNFMLIGAAFYHDRYRRTDEGWKISATSYDRTYDATMSLEGLNFNLKPGRALNI
ncbi:SnoaL-like protein [Arthrobacter sp. SLBN-53]|nr:SnoaL-like protein [Arthrobacter sp. SLBN-53]